MSERREYNRFEILGIANDELICLESITNVRCCGEKSGQIHIITMRPLSEETIENQKSEENLKEFWVEAVQADQTERSLSDWVEEVCYDAECSDQYFPFDDTSYRSETNYALEQLSNPERKKIMDYFEKYCEDQYETFKDFEVSSSTHYDSEFIRDKVKFTYRTKFGKKFTPLFDAFFEGEIDYDGLVNQIVAYVKENDDE